MLKAYRGSLTSPAGAIYNVARVIWQYYGILQDSIASATMKLSDYETDPPYQIQYIVPVPLEYRLQVVGISSTFILRKGVFPQKSQNWSTPQGTKEAPPTMNDAYF